VACAGEQPDADPAFLGDAGDGVGQQAAEEAARGDAQGERGQDRGIESAPPVGRQPLQLDGDHHEEGAGEEELGQRGERYPDGSGAALRAVAEHPQRGGRDDGGHDDERDDRREEGKGQGDAERVPDPRPDLAAAHPGGAEVAPEHARPPADAGDHRSAVEPELGTDGGERLRRRLELGVAGAEHRGGGVALREPGQRPGDEQQRDPADEPGGDPEGVTVPHRGGCRR
jgi:hypothetical protein